MARKNGDSVEIEVEEDFEDEDFDDVEVEDTGDDDGEDLTQPKQKQKSPPKQTDGFDFEAQLKRQEERAKNYVDHQIAKVNNRLNDHEDRIQALEAQVQGVPKSSPQHLDPHEQQSGLDKVLNVVLGVPGRAAMAIIDTTAFLAESAVDLITLGHARKAVQKAEAKA